MEKNNERIKYCLYCRKGRTFRPKQKFCSLSCTRSYLNMKKTTYVINKCLHCQKIIHTCKSINQRHCDRDCWKERIRFRLKGKGNPMFGKHHKESTKFKISNNRGNFPKGELNPNWRGGISKITPYRNKFWRKQRLKALDAYHPICNKCDSTKNLVVDHIVPCFVEENHEISNLQILCNRCNIKKSYEDAEKFNPEARSKRFKKDPELDHLTVIELW